MPKVLHITTHLGGGAGRVIANVFCPSRSRGNYSHKILCLDYLSSHAMELVKEANLLVVDQVNYKLAYREIKNADIVQIEWWNHPLLNKFLYTLEFPSSRCLIYSYVSGYYPPNVLTKELIDFSDIFVASTVHTFYHPLIQNLPKSILSEKIEVVYMSAGIERVKDVKPKHHKNFNVGYIGTVDFYKMHPEYVSMSAAVNIPNVKFIICGGGKEDYLRNQAKDLNVEARFDFRGFVKDIKPILEILDVFGYPLCREHYGTGEQVLIEAMVSGIPPVVFSHGAEKYIVKHKQTGLLVSTPEEYAKAIEYLYYDPKERIRLGENARDYARKNFGVEKTVEKFNAIYDKLIKKNKRKRTIQSHPKLPNAIKNSLPHSHSGAEIFMSSLGDFAEPFLTSTTTDNVEKLFQAENEIAHCSLTMRAETRGSVFHYCKVFPKDPFLLLWAGLILQNQGKHKKAMDKFKNAYENGCLHWRVLWYLVQSAEKEGATENAVEALKKVLNKQPHFDTAKDLLNRLSGKQR